MFIAGCNMKTEKAKTSLLTSTEIDSMYPGATEYYQMLCAACHGNKVMAFVDREWEKGHSVELLAKRISEGDEDDGMPAFAEAFTEAEITEMAEYIKLHIENLSVYDFDERPDIRQVFQSDNLNYTLQLVAENLESPWGMAFLPDEQMLISDRNGIL
jgi:hypothetical protein